MGLDSGHDFVDLSLHVLIDQLKMAPEEPPALADLPNYGQNRLRNALFDLIWLAAVPQTDMNQLEDQVLT